MRREREKGREKIEIRSAEQVDGDGEDDGEGVAQKGNRQYKGGQGRGEVQVGNAQIRVGGAVVLAVVVAVVFGGENLSQ